MSVPQFSEFDLIDEVASYPFLYDQKEEVSKTAKKKNPGIILGNA